MKSSKIGVAQVFRTRPSRSKKIQEALSLSGIFYTQNRKLNKVIITARPLTLDEVRLLDKLSSLF